VNAAELRQKPVDDLRREIAALERDIWKTRFQRGSEKAGDPNKVRTMRREVARMLTVLRERDLGIERGAKKHD
jgi:large subunit ribosomal protein L29